MLSVYSSKYYNMVSHLYDFDYLPFNQPTPKFEQNHKKDEI